VEFDPTDQTDRWWAADAVFDPARDRRERFAEMCANRRTKVQPSQGWGHSFATPHSEVAWSGSLGHLWYARSGRHPWFFSGFVRSSASFPTKRTVGIPFVGGAVPQLTISISDLMDRLVRLPEL
jgi:hypothetical protein